MRKPADSKSSYAGSGGAMLIGDISKVFLDAGSVDRYPCRVQANILDGIDAAAKGRFDVIGVVMDGTSSQLGPALRALRRSTAARIVLLAQMHEEPIARRLVAEVPGEQRLADTYLVCPTCLESFYSHAGLTRRGEDKRLMTEDGGQRTAPPDFIPPALAPNPQSAVRNPQSESLLPDLEQRIRLLEWLAMTDDLTGLRNRRYVWEFARQILEQAGPTGGRVTLLVFDIDNFKQYNDRYGHAAGDEVLRQAALLMRRCCRPHDVVSRIGGDEFAVVFWDDPHQLAAEGTRDRRSAATEHPREAITVAKRFQKEFGDADLQLLGPGAPGVLTISGGLASFPRDGATVAQLFKQADLALLDAKRQGKNRIYLVGEPQNDIAQIE